MVKELKVENLKNEDYLCCSIFNLICCVCFLGIPALIFSLKAKRRYRLGREEEAKNSASTARSLNIAGILIGIVFIFIYAILFISIIETVYFAGKNKWARSG